MALHPGLWAMNSGPQPFPSHSIYHCLRLSTPGLLAFLGHGSAQKHPSSERYAKETENTGCWPSSGEAGPGWPLPSDPAEEHLEGKQQLWFLCPELRTQNLGRFLGRDAKIFLPQP